MTEKDLNSRIAEAKGHVRDVCGTPIYWNPSSTVAPGESSDPYNYLSDKAATFDALESLIDAGWLAFRHRVFTDKRCLQSPVGCPHLCEGSTLSEAIWRAWLATAENSPLNGQKLTTEEINNEER